MPRRMLLVRDYLERALVVLPCDTPGTIELEEALEHAIALTRTPAHAKAVAGEKVIDFGAASRHLRPT